MTPKIGLFTRPCAVSFLLPTEEKVEVIVQHLNWIMKRRNTAHGKRNGEITFPCHQYVSHFPVLWRLVCPIRCALEHIVTWNIPNLKAEDALGGLSSGTGGCTLLDQEDLFYLRARNFVLASAAAWSIGSSGSNTANGAGEQQYRSEH